MIDSCSVYYIAVLIIAIVLRMNMRIRACLLLLSDAKSFTTPVQIQYGLLMMRVNGFINHVFIYRYFILRVNLAMHWRCILLVWSPTYSRWKNCWHLVILTQKIMWVMNNLGIYRYLFSINFVCILSLGWLDPFSARLFQRCY